jgi:hypothetical protein
MKLRTIGPHLVGATALVVLGLAAGAAVVGVPAPTDATPSAVMTSTGSNAGSTSPSPQIGADAICSALRIRHDFAVRRHPSDPMQARSASQSLLDLNC